MQPFTAPMSMPSYLAQILLEISTQKGKYIFIQYGNAPSVRSKQSMKWNFIS